MVAAIINETPRNNTQHAHLFIVDVAVERRERGLDQICQRLELHFLLAAPRGLHDRPYDADVGETFTSGYDGSSVFFDRQGVVVHLPGLLMVRIGRQSRTVAGFSADPRVGLERP